jgi:uncharacterized membrane protein
MTVGRPVPRAGFLLGAAGVVGLALLVHFLLVGESARAAGVAIAWLFTVAAAYALARAAGLGIVGTLVAAGLFVAVWYVSANRPYGMFLPPVASFALFLWFFGRTLLPGREPLVTAIARFMHGTLAPEVERYTRRVTAAWCVFFAAVAATSIALAVFAPLAVWSFCSNVLSYPLVGLMFASEYAIRRRRFPDYRHVPPGVLVRRIAEAGFFSGRSRASASRP